MFRKIFFLVLLVFLLTACFGKEESNTDGLSIYDSNESFSLRIPSKWETIEDTSSLLPKPKTGKIELVVSSKVKTDGFVNSLTVLSEDLEKTDITSSGYMYSIFSKTEKLLSSIDMVEEKTIVFGEGEEAKSSRLYIFDTKYNEKTPALRYFQTAQICGKKGYVLTLALPQSVKDFLKYEYLLSSFRCK